MDLGKKIKAARKNAGLTQAQLAEKCGFAPVTIQQYENGKREPRLKAMAKISSVLSVDMASFVSDKPVETISYNDEHISPKDVFEHYGYEYDNPLHGVGLWSNETVIKRLENLSSLVEQYAYGKQKVKIIFDYDPDFPRALLQVWGLS